MQTFLAQPGTVSQLFPKPKFYVVAGSYEPGSIVDLNQLGRVSGPRNPFLTLLQVTDIDMQLPISRSSWSTSLRLLWETPPLR